MTLLPISMGNYYIYFTFIHWYFLGPQPLIDDVNHFGSEIYNNEWIDEELC